MNIHLLSLHSHGDSPASSPEASVFVLQQPLVRDRAVRVIQKGPFGTKISIKWVDERPCVCPRHTGCPFLWRLHRCSAGSVINVGTVDMKFITTVLMRSEMITYWAGF